MEKEYEKYEEFRSRTGIIEGITWFWNNGFNLVESDTSIEGKDIETVLRFCELNPSFHMITMTNDEIFKNRYIPGQLMYFLAAGDADPRLEAKYIMFHSAQAEKEAGEIIAEQIGEIKRNNELYGVEETLPQRIYH